MLHRSRVISSLFVFAAALFLRTSPAAAQCLPDNLDTVPCCVPVGVTLPVFPAISQSSKFVCFRDCAPVVNANLCVTVDPPVPTPVCGVYTIKFKVRQCGGTMPILFQGNLRAQYSRNWIESPLPGAMTGVWRFLLNGDWKASAFLQASPSWASPNVKPGCYTAYNAMYVAGYIDYAFDCATSTWTAAWAFNHDCDRIHHPPGSPRPAPGAGYHPTRTWTFLGPGTGFVVDPTVGTITGVGPAIDEAVRWNDWSTQPAICRGEEKSTGNVVQLGPVCMCSTMPTAPGQYENTAIDVFGGCGSMSRTLLPPIVPMVQKRIGRWTVAGTFPGFEYLNIDMGDMDYFNSCTGLTTTEFFEGVTTLGGYPAMSYAGVPFGRTQMDLGSSNRSPLSMARRVGVPHITQFVINLNLP